MSSDLLAPRQFLETSGLRFHCAEHGSGPLVLLLHGFPEFWWGWRHQLGPLAESGLRVVAPDLRGYHLTERPASGYDIDTLVDDVRRLVHGLGGERCHLVGHDWGGILAWMTAMRHPEMVDRLAILNAPHPATYLREIRRGEQLLRSWYVGLFAIPALPELALSAGHAAGIALLLRGAATRSDTFGDAELDVYRSVWSEPGALGAALAYYRSFLRLGRRGVLRRTSQIAHPTLVLWGERDVALSIRLLDGLERWAPNLEIARFPDAGHWVQHEVAEEVNQRLVAFLRGGNERLGTG